MKTGPYADVILALAPAYSTERELGRGGAAIVFLAHDVRLPRRVAVKVLLRDIASAVNVDRFLREIQIAARLVHPHIVPLLDSGVAVGLPYYVMPFVEGESLRDRLIREPQLAVDEAMRIAREVADALDYAHAVGVIHRDIKPENILMLAGHAVVADFGIAKAFKVAGGRVLTDVDLVVGTPAYMSPEQASGDPLLDGRGDIYSLGAMLYEMLAGSPPFIGATDGAVIIQRFVEDPPPLRSLRRDTPPVTERVVMRALARDPADRYATARDFGAALDAARAGTLAVDDTPSIAVLPFANLSADAEGDFFSDGMTEELINALMRLRRVRVVARTTVFALKGKYDDVREIGRQLNVRSVLEGSIRRSGGHLRINAKLFNTADGFQAWIGQYDREVGDVFALQDEIARTIAETLQRSVLGGEGAPRERVAPEAYDLFLRGRHYWDTRAPADMPKALECYRQSIARDPGFAPPHACEAEVYAGMTMYGAIAPHEAMPRAREAAKRAIALDPALAEAHTALGAVHAIYEWDWAAAEAAFQRALAINPQYVTARFWLANFCLLPRGRFDEAIAELRRARAIDPLSSPVIASLGMALYYARRYDEALVELRAALAIDPDFLIALYFMARVHIERGDHAAAVAALERAHAVSGGGAQIEAALGAAHAMAGDKTRAAAAIAAIDAARAVRYVSGCQAAYVHAALGQTEEAVRGFERGYEERALDMLWLGIHPALDALRRDARITELLRRIGTLG